MVGAIGNIDIEGVNEKGEPIFEPMRELKPKRPKSLIVNPTINWRQIEKDFYDELCEEFEGNPGEYHILSDNPQEMLDWFKRKLKKH